MHIALNQPWPGSYQPLGVRFEFRGDTGPRLHFGFANPTPRNIRGATRGKLRLALVPAGKHTLFLLVQQPELYKRWADAPFSWGKLPREQRFVPSEGETSPVTPGYLFQVYLTDQFSVVRGMRVASLTSTFAAALDGMFREQDRHLPDFSEAAHAAEVQAAYKRWPRPEDMVRSAIAFETLGLPFGSERS